MNIDLPPQYNSQSVEKPIYEKWLASKAFHAVPDGRTNKFSCVIPPPNVTGALHLGHAINGTIQDILTRYHRMKGDNTLWMPGIDHAGIATQAVVEKTIFEKEHKSRHDLGRDELVRRIWEWKEQFGARILNQLASIGSSCDWDRTRFTLDEICARAVREAFFKMFKDGLIFRGKRLVNWDAQLQTAVADDEIYHETVKGQMTSIKYPVDGSPNEYLIVATTRPETMLGDTAVAVHPDDPRYTHLHGKFVILPLVGRRIPVITDGLLVDPKFGTGVVKVTPAHDPNDYATGQRHNLEQINLLTPDGKVNENGQGEFLGKRYSYVGLKFATAARKAVLADLDSLGLIAETKVHEHEVGHSDRSKTPIEPYLSDQWFVRMGDLADGATLADGKKAPGLAQAAMDAVTDGRVKITPERYAKSYLDWLGQKRDWCISRQLWWGHRIPVWTREVEPSQKFLEDARGHRGNSGILWAKSGDLLTDDGEDWGYARGQVNLTTGKAYHTISLREAKPEIERDLEKQGYVQDPDVLDTWFSSALWPISTMGWPATGTSPAPEDQLLPYFYPTSLLSTARDILTLWVARMVMFGLYCHGDIPFRDVYIHAVIQDGEGRTMSKSKGNGVDPVDIIQSHGADALRFTLASMATETQDIRMPVVKDPKTGINTSPKFDLGRNFANKIWNASRFILSNIDERTRPIGDAASAASNLEDRWILSRLRATIATVTNAINTYRFAELAQSIYEFFWNDLCDWYLEIAKSRIKAGDATVQAILLQCLETSLKLLHPMMPFVTEELWSKLPNRQNMLIIAPWPVNSQFIEDKSAEQQIRQVQAITRAIRDVRNQYGVPSSTRSQVTIRLAHATLGGMVEESKPFIESLANADIVECSASATKPHNAATAVLLEGEIYVAGVVDKAVEKPKLEKRRDELAKLATSQRNKLGNEAAIAKVPPQVVQGWRDQLTKYEEELRAIEKNLQELGA